MGKLGDAAAPSWSALGRAHRVEYVFLAATLVLLAFSEGWHPYKRHFYTGTTADLDLWHYSYPLKANHVPAWAVPCVATLTPLAVILGCFLGGRISRVEAHHACLLVVSCVATTGLLTNWIKCHVGRPRPHFVNRCWPNGARPVFAPDGTPLCADGAINPEEGIKSFPSGHTSWSTSGLGFLTFWLLGHLHVFSHGAAMPSRFVVALCPLLGAVWIGMSRIQDYWHHVEDVCAGFSLGLLMAFCYYRQAYEGLLSQHAGTLTAALRSSGRSGVLAPSSSRFGLLYPSGGGSDGSGEELPLSVPLYADDRV
ncbi:lipid phosphate phosphatase chloroplastic [Micractinium conductrix]|uniref:Lipid phosphate phosphatase chloroplastic n=1 Tax=Micractinium conductrix TaxID=554055 RepID=A0A2P6VD87_9CHLO|nr:lipid phosphate phosphatase chloroplastic [Micractinium conductrix]|eukprot:PSC72042.1 lipid phosphate phosphatase chloroplastic [Micractinium conductrix]